MPTENRVTVPAIIVDTNSRLMEHIKALTKNEQ